MNTVQFAVVAPVAAGVTADPRWMAAFARHVEACGFESIVAVEHTVLATRYDSVYPYDPSGRVELASDCPVPDPLDLLSFLAAHTDRLGLATGVLVLPNHHPVVLAKRAATVDVLSSGRLRLCVGVGWLREEIEACGTEFESRGRRADEQIAVLRALWDQQPDGVTQTIKSLIVKGCRSQLRLAPIPRCDTRTVHANFQLSFAGCQFENIAGRR